jgi:hydrogenase maturation protease
MEEGSVDILVLGVGNLLLQDEGGGVRAVELFEQRFETPPGVECLDGGTSGIELLHHIEGRDCLIILDVVKGGNPPGTVVRLEAEEVPATFRKKISPHQLGLADLLAAATLSGKMPAKVVLLGIEPKTLDTGLEMSAEVEGCMATVAEMVAEELASCGVKVRRRPVLPGGAGTHRFA